MFRPIRIRTGSVHFCPCNRLRLFPNNTPYPLLFQCVTTDRPVITDAYADPHNMLPIMGSHPIQQTADTGRPSMKDMRIDHHRGDITMFQPLLNGTNIRAAFKHEKRMKGRVLTLPCPSRPHRWSWASDQFCNGGGSVRFLCGAQLGFIAPVCFRLIAAQRFCRCPPATK